MSFCITCGNRLEIQTTGGNLKYKCTQCHKLYDATPEDTLIESINYGTDESIDKHRKYLKTAAFDPTNPKEIIKCPKCPENLITKVRITKKEIVIYACKCGYIWRAS